MRKLFGRVMTLVFFALMVCMLGRAVAESEWKEITASSSPFVYSDELLMGNEYQLDPDIAKVSVALSSDVYSESTVRASLSQMGFENIETYGSYAIPRTVEDNDYVAYAIAHKAYKDYIIYVVPIRGTPKNNEWISDFTPGNREDGYHEGFYKASEHVYDSLLDEFSKDGYTNNKRIILLTGHSRGGAVANIIAEKLISSRYGKIFAYTFACPAVRKGELTKYKNVYNFNIENDVVPYIPLKEWGFERYGTDEKGDMSIWSNKAHLSVPELDSTLKTLQKFVPDIETCNTKECKLAFGIVAWAMAGANLDDLPKIIARASVDSDVSLISSIENFNFFKEEYDDLVNDINTMYDFYDQIAMDLNDMTEEEFEKMRWENPEVFALYDTFAITAVTSAKALEELRPKVKIARQALITGYKAKDIIMLFLTPERNVMDEIANAHLCEEYVKWINHDYYGYNGHAGNNYENTEIVINTRTISPNCFASATGNYSVKMEKVVVVGRNAFNNSTGLIKVDIGEDVRYLGASAFSGCASLIGTVKLPEGMTEIPDNAFYGCSSMEEVIIPDSIKTIGKAAFRDCVGLKKVTMPLSVKFDTGEAYFSNATFVGCGYVEEVTFTAGDGSVFSEDHPYAYAWNGIPYTSKGKLKKATFAEGVTELPARVLMECSVEEVILPSTLEKIGESAFNRCRSLVGITIPENVAWIGEGAFYACSSLESITIPEKVTVIERVTFYDCYDLVIVRIEGDIISIGEWAFGGCTYLAELTKLESVKEIGASAFERCVRLKGDFPISASTEKIGASAFSGCASLSGSVKLPEGMTEIPDNAFYGCNSMEEVIIPDSIETIGKAAFQNCVGLKKVTMPLSAKFDTGEAYYSNATFVGCGYVEELTFTAGDGSIFSEDYPYGYVWNGIPNVSKGMLKKVTFVEGVTELPARVLMECSVEEVILPSTLEKIGESAFNGCSSLAGITIPENVAWIGEGAFYACSSLESITIPEKVTVIERVTFVRCFDLATVRVEGNIISIGEWAFGGCSYLAELTKLESVKEIGASAFEGCMRLKGDFPIGAGTERIGASAFSGCASLIGTVKLPEGMTEIPDNAFYGCSSMEEVIIADSIETIGKAAFQNCVGLKKVTMPLSVKFDTGEAYFSNATFVGCENVEELTFTAGDGSIFSEDYPYGYAWHGIPDVSKGKLKKATFAEGITELPERVLYGCDALEKVVFLSRDTEIGQRICAENVEIHGYYGSTAQEYAKNYNHPFVPLADCVHNAVVLPSIEVGCETDGLTEGAKCSFCDAILTAQEIIPAKGHDIVTDAAVEPNCTESGLTEGKYCSVCGEVFAYQTIAPATGHKPAAGDGVPPTCTTPGWTAESKCEVCREIIEAKEEIPALGHTPEVLEGKEASCTIDGLTEGAKCSVCGEILTAQEVIPAKGHETVVNAAVDPTCTKTGLTEGRYCSVCGEILAEQTVIPALGHKVAAGEGVPPTCTMPGWTENSHCEICGKMIEERVEIPALGHSEVIDAAVEATCTETGLTEGKHCEVCDEVIVAQTVVDALGHNYDKVVTAPTCTTAGYTTYTCAVCSDSYKADEVAANGHTEVIDAAVAATCTATGLTEGKHCSVCGEVTNVQEIVAALGHDYNAVIIDPTCEEAGYTTYSCTVCGDSYKADEVTALGHTEVVDAAVAPTCTATGLTEGKHCSVCDAVLVAQTMVAALGHKEEIIPAIEAECEKTGLTEGKKCSVCGTITVKQNTVSAKGHTEVIDAVIEPTCIETGLTEGIHCAVCEEVLVAQKVVAALGHTEVVDEAVAATCTETGLTDGIKCSVCGKILKAQEEISALGHKEETIKGKAATCTETGLTDGLKCSVCGEVLKAQEEISALGHKGETIKGKAATCTETGLTDGSKCSVCGEILKAQEEISVLGHSEVIDEAIVPTCIESGLTEGKHCSICDEVLVEQSVVDALGHTEVVDAAVAPTCTETGLTEGVHCSVCNEIIKVQEEIPATGHDDGEWFIVTEATMESEGLKELRCTVCEFVLETEVIPKVESGDDERIVGDVTGDGVVDGRDLLRLAKYIGGHEVDIVLENASVNGDDVVDGRDLLRLAKYIGGYDVELN